MAKGKESKKKNDPRKYAQIGLWVSGLAAFATIFLFVYKLIVTAGFKTLLNSNWLNLSLGISVLLIVLGLGIFALLDPQRVREVLTGRQARHGSNAAIVSIAFIGILIVVNLIVFQNPVKPADMTEDKQNSLATETLDTLKALTEPVHATAFFTQQSSPDAARKLLENYGSNSSGKFTYEFVDPDQNPLAAQQAGISGDGKIYLQMGDQHELVSYASEQEITAALIRLMNPGERTVYFLTGHGERDIENAGDTSYTHIKTALEAKNYTVKTLNLITVNAVPENSKAIIIADPLEPISADELTLLQNYVAQGGALVVMEEPIPMTNFGDSPDLLATYLATTWGISLDNDIVIDTTRQNVFNAVAAVYSDHPITAKLQSVGSYYFTARSLSKTPNTPAQPVALVLTADATWGETDFESLKIGQIEYNPDADIIGPLTLTMAAEDTNTNGRVVVFGDADFASDAYFDQYANGDMLINSIDWAAGQDKQINLTSHTPISRSLNPLSSTTLVLMLVSFIFIIPGLVVVSGIVSWLIRRARG